MGAVPTVIHVDCIDCGNPIGGRPNRCKVRCPLCQKRHRSKTEKVSRLRVEGAVVPERQRPPYASPELMQAERRRQIEAGEFTDIPAEQIEAIMAASIRRQRWEAANA